MTNFVLIYKLELNEKYFLCYSDRTSYLAHEPFYKEIYPTSKNIPEASPRVVTLSAHKNASYEYQYDRDLPTKASETSEASARVGELAR